MDPAELRFLESSWVGRPLSDWSSELVAECQRIGGDAFRANLNVYTTLAHHPHALAAWVALGRTVVDGSGLDPADRERVILWTTSRCGGKYPFARHVLLARAAGVSNEEIQRIADRPSESWPTPLQDGPDQVLPLVAFYSAASFVLESSRTPPDADVLSEWPEWQRRDWRQPGIQGLVDRLGETCSTEAGKALEHLVAVLIEDRELPAPEWNGVVQVARQAFERNNVSAVTLDGPVDLDADVVKLVGSVLGSDRPGRPQPGPCARHSVEAILLAAIAGVLSA